MQVFANREKIGALSKTGNTTVQLSASVITVGAKQYTTSNLVCDLTISGAGGLDTGAVAASTPYYLYAVDDNGTAKIICSLSGTAPTGFTVSKLISGFFSNDSSQVGDVGTPDNAGILKRDIKIKWQKKSLITQVITNQTVTELSFSNLEIGKTYRLSGQLDYGTQAGDYSIMHTTFTCGGTVVFLSQQGTRTSVGWGGDHPRPLSSTFTADGTDLTCVTSLHNDGTLRTGSTFVILEEVANPEITTDWT